MILTKTSKLGWLSEKMTHFGTMNHHIHMMSHRENGIGFLHLRTLSIQVQVPFEHEIHFWTDSKFSKLEKFNFRFSNSKKRRKVFFLFFGPSFRSIVWCMPKIAIFSEGIFKMKKTCWMKIFNHQRSQMKEHGDFKLKKKKRDC